MKRWMIKIGCALLTLLLCGTAVLAVGAASDYTVSSTSLTEGKNGVTASSSVTTTLFVFKPTKVGAYRLSVDKSAARLSYWYGTPFYVTGLAEETTGGSLVVTCSSVGQTLLVGLSGVSSATITVAEEVGYVPPAAVVYEPYVNRHTPVSDFALPTGELTRVNVLLPQTLVADADGIYHLGSINGPILYVNMCAASYADLYACYHPLSGSGALYMRGRYKDETGKECGYEFLEAMRPYAESLDDDGYYYLTVDLATYIQIYGDNQGWFRKDSSPFSVIKQGRFIEESAWLVNAYYLPIPYTTGDANNDGKINNRDLGVLQQHLNGWSTTMNPSAADMDGNGTINNRDLGALQKQLNK